MIYTCTLNPSIDYVVNLEEFNESKLNRADKYDLVPGGKGINVSLVLNNLGVKSKLLGFLGGFTGNYLYNELLKKDNLLIDFTHIEGTTRINIKLKSGNETEVNMSGPVILKEECDDLLSKVSEVTKNDVFILSGSVPSSIKGNIYVEIAKIVKEKNAKLIVDSTKRNLMDTLEYKPFLIKPNKEEFEEIFDVKINKIEDIVYYSKKLQKLGAENVLVSLGGEGSVLVTKDKTYKVSPIIGNVINTVGAGDSMVSGFIHEYLLSKCFKSALKFGSACGSATAFSEGLATKEKIEEIIKNIEIKEIG